MPQVVQFTAPFKAELVPCDEQPMLSGTVRVRTWYSGISAGTELTAYRGSNPFLKGVWDAKLHLFREGPPTFGYPIAGWGYSEVGQVVEVAGDVEGFEPGQVVHGIWGHRSEAVVPIERISGILAPEVSDPIRGVFARSGAIAFNAVLAADLHLGERVAVFGQGVMGLLATRLAVLSGAWVVAVDRYQNRLERARTAGAELLVNADEPEGAGAVIRRRTEGMGVDAAIEVSGSYRALHEAIRAVAIDGVVATSGFYQGGGAQLRLGEEFHHNRVRIVASQISGTPLSLGGRWNERRLTWVFMKLVADGKVDVAGLVTDLVDATDVSEAFERLDQDDHEILQVVLRFDAAPDR